jgi:predicted NBD/HSP70 family sugar kinase
METDQKPLRSYDIRERNEKLILNLIYNRGVISQSEVVSLTGLKPPTVFRIFATLENHRYIKICEVGKEPSDRKGRKPLYYCIEPDAHYVIGVDFWARSAAAVVVNFGRTPVYEDIVNFPEDLDAEQVVEALTGLIKDSIRRSKVPADKILGIGIGGPGVVDLKQGSVLYYPRIRGMVNFNIRERMEKAFSVPVYIHNNSSVIALSEYRYGKAKDFTSLLLVLIRSGVGGAFMVIGQNRRPCWCGQKGCLETELSEDAITADLKERAGITGFDQVAQALATGDKAVIEVLTEKGELLSRCIRNLYMVLRPQAFLIVTRMQALSEFLTGSARETLKSLGFAGGLPEQAVSQPPVVLSEQYDPIIAGRGATDLVFDPFFMENLT